MPVLEKENKVIFFEPPRTFTFWDVLIVLCGLSVTVFCIYGIYKPIDSPKGALAGAGLLFILCALQPFLSHFRTKHTTIFDYSLKKIIFEKKNLTGQSIEEYNFAEVNTLQIKQDFDIDRPNGWYIEIELKTGAQIEVSNSFHSVEKSLEQIVQTANKYLTK